MRVCPTRNCKQVGPNAPKGDAPKKNRFYALRTKGAKPDEGDDDGKFLYFFRVMSSFYVGDYS